MALNINYYPDDLDCYPDDLDYEVELPRNFYIENILRVISWLEENFGDGERNGNWDIWEWDSTETAYFTFRYKHDAMAFKLAWVE